MSKKLKNDQPAPVAPEVSHPAADPQPEVVAPGRPATRAEVDRWKFVKAKIDHALAVAAAGVAVRKEALALAREKKKPAEIARLERLVASDDHARAELRRFYDRKLKIVAAEIGGVPEETKDGWVVRS